MLSVSVSALESPNAERVRFPENRIARVFSVPVRELGPLETKTLGSDEIAYLAALHGSDSPDES